MLYLYYPPASARPRFCTCGKFVSEHRPMTHPSRNLDSFVLLCGGVGTLHITQDTTDHLLTPGRFVLLFPSHPHHGTCESAPPLSYSWCHFYLPGAAVLDAPPAEADGGILLPESGDVTRPDRIPVLFHQLTDLSRSDGAVARHGCDCLLDVLLTELSMPAREGGQRSAIVSNIVEWIRLNACEISGVAEVAAYFGYNPEYLTTLIRRATGKTIVDHVNAGRIERAKEFLIRTDYPVCEIAGRCGFSDEKYFFRVFRALTDLTPNRYRNAYTAVHWNNR